MQCESNRQYGTGWQLGAFAPDCCAAWGWKQRSGGRTHHGRQFVTAMVLVLAAVLFMRLGFAAQEQEEKAGPREHRQPENTVKAGKRKVG